MKVGIDFGTSTSEIAYVGTDGQLVLVPNHIGEYITPSVVYIQEDFTPIVGKEAKEKALIEPENAMLEVKRLFGQKQALTARGRIYTPVEAATMIIKYLVECAATVCGEEIDSAVITVPAYFTDAQRKDVLNAGIQAGLDVSRIINEPTAASLDYGVRHLRDCKHVLVYDLGGGTLDVTVLELYEGVVDVKSSCGNNALGGKDFDKALMDYIVKTMRRKYNVEISDDLRAMMRVKIASEQCKIGLSSKESHKIELPFLGGTADTPAGFDEEITREYFEKLIYDQVWRTEKQIKTALGDAALTPQDIDMVLLVGGSTRIPLVMEFLNHVFGYSPAAAVDPDLAVVRGAALQAGVLSGNLGEDSIVLTDICSHSLSTMTLKDVSFGVREKNCDILIPRNTTLPAETSKIFQTADDYQTGVNVTAYQGESNVPEDNELIGAFFLDGVPKARAGKEKIRIHFSYDLNGILEVSAEIVSTGKSASVTVDTSKTGKQLNLENWASAPNIRGFKHIITKAERLIKLHGEISSSVEIAADNLKKALLLEWSKDICAIYKKELETAIEGLENGLL